MVEFHAISMSCESDAQLLHRFYFECFVAAFPDEDERESLENIQTYLRLKDDGRYDANGYHVIVACDDDEPVAGSIADYFVEPNAGVIEYLAVKPGQRRGGLGTTLLRQTESALALDAQRSGQQLAWVVAEVDDPIRTPLSESGMNPFTRASIWHGWGYRRLDFPYVQPALLPGTSPVETLLLAAKTLSPEFTESIPTEKVLSFVHEYLRLAMRIPRPEADPDFCAMAEWIRNCGRPVALVGLGDYAGVDGRQPRLRIEEVTDSQDPELHAVLEVYSTLFTDPSTAIPADDFRHVLGPNVFSDKPGCRYHLWSISGPSATECAGIASFFTLTSAGFIGYLGLVPPLRGAGHLPYLLSRIERQMIEDSPGARGTYLECAGQLERDIFARPAIGCYELDVAYTQPTNARLSTLDPDRPLHLLYKPFGRTYRPPEVSAADFLAAMREIMAVVYGLDEPQSCKNYVSLERSLAGRHHVPVVPTT